MGLHENKNLNVIIYQDTTNKRARHLCQAMYVGIRKSGDYVVVQDINCYDNEIKSDVAVIYGLRDRLLQIFHDHCEQSHIVFMDLGYFKRTIKNKLDGYHKICVNSMHPNNYFQNKKNPDDRLKKLNIITKPFTKTGNHILVAGMSDKSAGVNGYRAEQYEKDVIQRLRKITKRTIIYRPKPSWGGAKPIDTVGYSSSKQKLKEVFKNCWASVTHHSNVAIDSIIAGIPAFIESPCAAFPVSSLGIADIDKPYYPDNDTLYQWLCDLSYAQWTPDEMRSGKLWSYLKYCGALNK